MKLLMLSGGIESTCILWELLNAGEEVHCHHIILDVISEQRASEELEAVGNIYNFLNNKGFAFKASASNLVWATSNLFTGRDAYAVLLFAYKTAGALARAGEKDIEVVLGYKTESHINAGNYAVMWQIYHNDFNNYQKNAISSTINYPLLGIDKKEVINRMPKELFDLTSYCRRPVKGKPCGLCNTCIKVKAVNDLAKQKNQGGEQNE